MKLIDADEAFRVLSDYYHHRTETQANALREALNRVPEAVVRCKECKHFKQDIPCVGGTYNGCDQLEGRDGCELYVEEDFSAPTEKGKPMSLDKSIAQGKERRKQFRGSKAFYKSCRNHGSCEWCVENRMYKNLKRLAVMKELENEYEID